MDRTWSFDDVEEYLAPYNRYFSRTEARRLACEYVMGLLSEGERKSVEPMSQRLGVSTRSLQRLLTEVKWDHDEVLREYLKYMYDRYSRGNGVLVAGLSEFKKRGGHSVCVARQYSENAGRMMTCQMACDIIYVENDIAWPIAMELYVPRFWGTQRDKQIRIRRLKAGIPSDIRHRQRWALALDQVGKVKDFAGVHSVVSADRAFGAVPEFSDSLDESGQRFLVEIPGSFEIFIEKPFQVQARQKSRRRGRPKKRSLVMGEGSPPVKVSTLVMHLEGSKILKNAAGSDTIRDRVFRSYNIRVWPAAGWHDGIIHRPLWLSVSLKTRPGEAAFFLSNFPDGLTEEDLSIMVHAHKLAAVCKKIMKDDLGLLHHEGRSWTGWHRHVLLVFLAWGFLLERKGHAWMNPVKPVLT